MKYENKTISELKDICKKYCLDNEDVYIAKCNTKNLPEMPEEIYRNFSSFYDMFNEIFKKSTSKRR